MNQDQIQSLLEALALSPGNVPLRIMLADAYFNGAQFADAINHYKEVLSHESANIKSKVGLVQCYYATGEYSTAMVIAEEIAKHPQVSAEVLVIYAKLLIKENAREQAVEAYRRALAMNVDVADEELDNQLKGREVESASSDFADEIEKSILDIEKPKVKFEDVGGMDNVKEEINLKIIMPLKHPDLYKAYGKSTGGGILLYGPPGCGKTHMARATAGEVNAQFISIGINDILDMWIGNSEKNLHNIFEVARNSTPCVLFFDEVDALGASRSDMKQSAGRHLINQFLHEMDGLDDSNEGILILAATNAPWHLDSAFRRPGRFDRIIFVPPPDEPSRESIFNIQLKGKPVADVDTKQLAKGIKDFSGADIKSLIDIAIEDKLRESFKTGRIEPITTKDLQAATKKITPSTAEWFVSARNYALYANQAGLYDPILQYLNIKK